MQAQDREVRVSEPLARNLEAAWRRYDDAIRDDQRAELGAETT